MSEEEHKKHDSDTGLKTEPIGGSCVAEGIEGRDFFRSKRGKARYYRLRSPKAVTLLSERAINDYIRNELPEHFDFFKFIQALNYHKAILTVEDAKKIQIEQNITKQELPSLKEILSKNPPEVAERIIKDNYGGLLEIAEEIVRKKRTVEKESIQR